MKSSLVIEVSLSYNGEHIMQGCGWCCTLSRTNCYSCEIVSYAVGGHEALVVFCTLLLLQGLENSENRIVKFASSLFSLIFIRKQIVIICKFKEIWNFAFSSAIVYSHYCILNSESKKKKELNKTCQDARVEITCRIPHNWNSNSS